MSISTAHRTVPLYLIVILSTLACDNDDRVHRVGPSRISFSGIPGLENPVNTTDFFARGVTLQSPVVTPQLVPDSSCPVRPPFLVPVRIVAGGFGDADLFLDGVDMRFVDRAGRFGGSKRFARSDLVDLFGSVTIPHAGRRSFPLAFPLGCAGGRAGLLTVDVFAIDGHRRRVSKSLTLSVN